MWKILFKPNNRSALKSEMLKWAVSNKTLLISGLSVALIIVVWAIVHFVAKPPKAPIVMIDVNTPDSIVIHRDSLVTPIVYTHVPNLAELNISERKQRFIHMMLPSILLAITKIQHERAILLEKIDLTDTTFYEPPDSAWVEGYMEKFKAADLPDLLNRMQTHPASIILAQAAIESGWGTSRFFKEANNVFGMWSYNSDEPRIRAGEARSGKSIFLRKYDTLFQSVYDYLLTVARSHAYEDFREARLESQNAYRLIWFLSNYSEKRVGYVISLRQMMEFNDLTRFDHYRLKPIDKRDENWKKLMEL